MLWAYFTLLAVFLWSLVNIIDKHILSKYIKNPMIFLIVMSLFGLMSALVASLFTKIFIPTTGILLISLGIGIIYAIVVWFYYKSLIVEEVSRVIPLFSISAIFVLILATIFLGEIFTFEKYIGIFLIVLGSILISLKKEVKFKLSKALLFMVIGGLFLAVYNVLLKFILNSIPYWNAFFWTRMGTFLVFPLLLSFYYKPLIKTIKKYPISGAYLFAAGGLNVVGVLMITIAFSIGYATLVSALGEIQPLSVLLIVILLSIFRPKFIKEELKGSIIFLKLLAIFMIIFGSILII